MSEINGAAETPILVERTGAVARVVLNRPDRLNSFTVAMHAALREALEAIASDETVRAVLLTGAGRGFCAGADMDSLSAGTASGGASFAADAPAAPPPFDPAAPADFHGPHAYFPAVPKPVIAAINGPCAGLGLVYALYCDQRFAAAGARFTTAFARRGLIAEHGISWTLPRLAGLSRALDLLVSARTFDADEALRLGVVDRVLPPEQLLAAARAYAADLAANVSPRSMAVIKRQLWTVDRLSLGEAIAVADREMQGSFGSADFREGVAHFVERRPAAFPDLGGA